MNYYQEITLLPEEDVSLGFIWQNVFQQVHIALVEHKVAADQSAIAVGFPQYGQKGFPLGSKLRLFAKEQAALEKLDICKWLSRLEDYTHVKGIKAVPDEAEYVVFSRKHVKTPARIEKDMQAKAKLWSEKSAKPLVECLLALEKSKPKGHCTLPFIFLHSQKTKQRSPDTNSKFPLFIQMKVDDKAQLGTFDCYGLSKTATVPWF